jgi:drug/metabolite transporter (DMT)-like permease
MNFPSLSDHRKGLLLTTIGGLALSTDVPLIRLAHGEAFSILAVRSLATLAVSIALLVFIRARRGFLRTQLPGWIGLSVGLFYGISTICFLMAIYHTAAANVLFILAFNPVFAALLSWIFLRELPTLATMLAMMAMIFGVGIIVRGGLANGHALGDFLAMLAALSIACAITISRVSRRDMGFVPLLAAVVPAAIGLYQALPSGLSITHPGWILLNGAVLMPVAFWCLATGPRYLSAPEVALFYLLETILAPIWVWLIFGETPSHATLTGGFVLVLALFIHSAWQARLKASRRATAA